MIPSGNRNRYREDCKELIEQVGDTLVPKSYTEAA
jgi:hypothetical protein